MKFLGHLSEILGRNEKRLRIERRLQIAGVLLRRSRVCEKQKAETRKAKGTRNQLDRHFVQTLCNVSDDRQGPPSWLIPVQHNIEVKSSFHYQLGLNVSRGSANCTKRGLTANRRCGRARSNALRSS